MHTIVSQKWNIILVIALLIIVLGGSIQQAASQDLITDHTVYLPTIMGPPSEIEITNAWIGNAQGISLDSFLPEAPMQYIISGKNNTGIVTSVELSWNETGPCGTTQIFTDTVQADPGIWVHAYPSTAPDCLGEHIATAQITGDNISSEKTVNFRIATTSIVISDKQGFDRCNMPSIDEMQTWWDTSPYYVTNVYLGGISYDNTTGCSNDNIDTNWIQSVADQGWTYLLTWVGPQSPCSGYTYKMSYDADLSYQEGQDEADAAIQAAANIGLPGNIIIYYDVEGYGNETNSACRNVVASFINGWTERLHETGAKSGAYGSPCNSHVSDWATITSPPDDVWVAHWIDQNYNPDATVWDLACLSNNLWPNHQRARQYAGDHIEYWGGVSLRIDSNVLDGEVVSLATSTVTTTTQTANLTFAAAQIREMELLSENRGWLIDRDRLLSTQDGGIHWDDLTPSGISRIWDVNFAEISKGLLLYQNDLGLGLLSTLDGGASWNSDPLPFSADKFASATLNFSDADSGRVELALSTGSSFNLVRQFSTEDGGQTWSSGEIISLPINEGLENRIYAEQGFTPLNSPAMGGLETPADAIQVDWLDNENGWVLTQQGTCQGDKVPVEPDAQPWQCSLQTQLWTSSDGGQIWAEITPQ